jgi:hypothetical protein
MVAMSPVLSEARVVAGMAKEFSTVSLLFHSMALLVACAGVPLESFGLSVGGIFALHVRLE